MPQMGVSVSEGTVTKWLKQVGEHIESDETLLEISTDKVDTEVPSPGSGVVTEILVNEGETVEVGTVLARISPEGAAPPGAEPAPTEAAPEAAPAVTAEAPSGRELRRGCSARRSGRAGRAAEPAAESSSNGRTFVSPVVARIAGEHGIDPSRVPGTGIGGRVTKKDILSFVESGRAAHRARGARRGTGCPGTGAWRHRPRSSSRRRSRTCGSRSCGTRAACSRRSGPARAGTGGSRARTGARGRRDVRADERDAPRDRGAHAPLARHVDARDERDRGRHDEGRPDPRAAEEGVPVGLRRQPDLPGVHRPGHGRDAARLAVRERARSAATGSSRKNFVNLGFAVELADGKGLIVPVVKNAETLNLLGMAKGIADIAARARNKQLIPDDVTGGSFTITNPGGYGTFLGTPIISQPQVGILGTYAIVKRPWVITDEAGADAIAIRSMMNLTLTYDHRLVDGAYAGRFLRDLRDRLQTWGENDY